MKYLKRVVSTGIVSAILLRLIKISSTFEGKCFRQVLIMDLT
jgi:hypothetical protein